MHDRLRLSPAGEPRRLSEIIARMVPERELFEKVNPEFAAAAMCKSLCELEADAGGELQPAEAAVALIARGYPVKTVNDHGGVAWQAFEEFRALKRIAVRP